MKFTFSCKYHLEEISCFVKRSCMLTNFFASNFGGILKLPGSVFYLGAPHTPAGPMQGSPGSSSADTDRPPPTPSAEAAEHGDLGPPRLGVDLSSPWATWETARPSLADRKACSSHICHHVAASRETVHR